MWRDPARLYVGGWLAGGHLAAMLMDEPLVAGGLTISGLFDLEPIRLCYLNEELGLDAEQARRNSPLLNLPVRERWAPGSHIAVPLPGGIELLALDGSFSEGGEDLTRLSWLRLPAGAAQQASPWKVAVIVVLPVVGSVDVAIEASLPRN